MKHLIWSANCTNHLNFVASAVWHSFDRLTQAQRTIAVKPGLIVNRLVSLTMQLSIYRERKAILFLHNVLIRTVILSVK